MLPSKSDKSEIPPRLRKGRARRVDCRDVFSREHETTASFSLQDQFPLRDQLLGGARKSTQHIRQHGAPLPLVWVVVLDNAVPPYAVPFSEADNGPQFIARAVLEGYYHLGRAGTGLPHGALITYGTRQLTVQRYEVLCFATAMRWGIAETQREALQQSSVIVSSCIHSFDASGTRSDSSSLLDSDIFRIIPDDGMPDIPFSESNLSSSLNKFKFASPLDRRAVEEKYVPAAFEVVTAPTAATVMGSPVVPAMDDDVAGESLSGRCTLSVLQGGSSSRTGGHSSVDDSWQSNLPVSLGTSSAVARMEPRKTDQKLRRLSLTTQSHSCPRAGTTFKEAPSIVEGGVAMHNHSHRRTRSLSAVSHVHPASSPPAETTSGPQKNVNRPRDPSPASSPRTIGYLSPIDHLLLLPSTMPEPSSHSTDSVSTTGPPAQRPLSAERIVRREHWGDVQPNSANRAKLSSAVRVSSPLASSSHLSAVSSPGAGKHRSSVDVREEDTVLDAAEFLDTVRPSLHAVVEESHRSSTIIGTQRQPHNRHRQEAVSLRSLVPSPVTPGTVVDGKRLQLARDTPPIVSGDVDIAHSSSVVKTFEQPSRSTTRIPSPETERARLPREEVESSTRSKVVTRYRIERNSDQVTQELAYPSSAEDKGNSHDTQQGVGAPHVVSVNPVKTPPSWSPPFSLSHGQTVTSTEHVMSDRDVHTTTLAVGGASVAQRLGGNKPQDQSRVQRKRERAMDTDWHRSMEITMTTLGRAPARIKDEVQAPLSLPISPLVVPRGVGSPSTTLIEPQDFHPSRERPVKLDADHHRSQISSNPTLSSERKSSSSVGPLSSSADGAVHVTTDISLAEEFAVVAASLLVAVSVGGGSAAAQGSDHMHSTDVTILGQAIEDSDSRQTHTLPLIASVSPRTQTIELVSTDIQCAPPHEVKTQLGFVEEESRASEQRGHVRPPSPMGPRPPVLKSRAVHFVVGSDNAGGSGQGYVSLTQSHVHEIEKTISESSRAELVQVQQLISQGDVVDNTGTAPQPAHLLLSNPVTVPTQRSYSLDARPQAVGAMAMHQSVDNNNNNQLDMSVVATDPSKSSAGSCASSDKVQEKLRPRIKRKPVPPIHSELSRTEHSTESSEEDSFKFVQDIGASPTASTQCSHASVGGAGCSEDLRQLESDQSRDHWNSFLDVTSHAAASRTQRKYQVPISKYLLPESDVDTGLVTSRKREGNDDRTASHKPCDPAIREDDVAGQEKDMEVAENSTGIVDSLSLESSLVATTALPTAYSTTTEQSCEFPAGTPHHVDDRDDEHDRTVHKSSVTDLDTATAQQSKPCTINTEEVAVYQFTPQQSVVVNLPEFPSFTTSSISSTRVSSDIGINMDVGRASASIQTPRIETTEDQPQTEHVVHTYGLLGACPRAPSDSFSSMAHLTSIFESEVLPNVCADQATESCLGPDRSNMVLSAVMQSHSGHIDALPSIQMRENQAKSERVQFAMGNEEIHDSNELMASKTFLDCDGKTLSNDDRDRFDSRPRKPVSVSSSRGPLQSSVRSERPSSEPDKETTSQRSRLEWTEMELDITTGSAPLAAPQQHITVVTTPLKNIVVLDSIQLCSHSEKTLAGLTPTANKTAGPTSTTDGGTPRGQATESAGGGLCMNTLTLRTQRLLSPPHPTPITPHDDETVHLQELSGNELQHELTISELELSSVLCLQGFTTQTTDSLSGSPAAKAERSFVEDDSEHVRIDEKSSPALSPLTRPAVSAQCETVVDCLSVYQSEESGRSSRRVLVPPQTAETDDGVHKVILSVDRSGFVAQKEVSVEIERASSPDYHCQEGSGNSSRSPISSVTDSYVGDDPLAKDPILPSVSARSQHGSPVTSTLPGLVDNHVQTTSALFNETSEDFVNEEKLDAERHGGAPFPPPPDHQDQPETANSPVSERPSPEVVLDQTTTEFQLRSGYVYVEHQGDLATRWVEPGSDEAAIMSRRDGAPVLPPEPEAEPSTSPAEPSSVTPSQACRDERDHPQKSAHLVSAQLDPSSEATPEYRTCGPSAGAAPLSQDSPSFFPDFASSGVSEFRIVCPVYAKWILPVREDVICQIHARSSLPRPILQSSLPMLQKLSCSHLPTVPTVLFLLCPVLLLAFQR
ncbi:hypothetical protein BS17DRAFT_478206 [Gyrodon lividus]|nr:hypothetical protein BS17DRAFT_478206 [Gyrodon lividus]